jgi:hypothetical protein
VSPQGHRQRWDDDDEADEPLPDFVQMIESIEVRPDLGITQEIHRVQRMMVRTPQYLPRGGEPLPE